MMTKLCVLVLLAPGCMIAPGKTSSETKSPLIDPPTLVNINHWELPLPPDPQYPLDPYGNRPDGIIEGPSHQIYISEQYGGNIVRVTLDADNTPHIEELWTGHSGKRILATPDDSLWILDANGYLGHITNVTGDLSAATVQWFPLGWGPTDMTIGPDGNLWVLYYSYTGTGYVRDSILRVSNLGGPDGPKLTEFSLPGITSGQMPYTIATGPDGNLWFTEYFSSKIARYQPPCTSHPQGVVTELDIPGPGIPFGITGGPDGNIWFSVAWAWPAPQSYIGRVNLDEGPSPSMTKFPLPQDDGRPVRNPIQIMSDDNTIWIPNFGGSIGYMLMDGTYGEFSLPDVGDATAVWPGSDRRIWFVETAFDRFGVVTIQ